MKQPPPTIEELDGILTLAREAWLAAPNAAAERKARKQIDALLDTRLELMKDRDALDIAPPDA